jgi:hypothetical protein
MTLTEIETSLLAGLPWSTKAAESIETGAFHDGALFLRPHGWDSLVGRPNMTAMIQSTTTVSVQTRLPVGGLRGAFETAESRSRAVSRHLAGIGRLTPSSVRHTVHEAEGWLVSIVTFSQLEVL